MMTTIDMQVVKGPSPSNVRECGRGTSLAFYGAETPIVGMVGVICFLPRAQTQTFEPSCVSSSLYFETMKQQCLYKLQTIYPSIEAIYRDIFRLAFFQRRGCSICSVYQHLCYCFLLDTDPVLKHCHHLHYRHQLQCFLLYDLVVVDNEDKCDEDSCPGVTSSFLDDI